MVLPPKSENVVFTLSIEFWLCCLLGVLKIMKLSIFGLVYRLVKLKYKIKQFIFNI